MANLEQIDTSRPLFLTAMQGSYTSLEPMDLDTVTLTGAEASLFLACAAGMARTLFEFDLQSVANDRDGRPLLSAWPGVMSFGSFCRYARDESQSAELLFSRLCATAHQWRLAGCNYVDITGYLRQPGEG